MGSPAVVITPDPPIAQQQVTITPDPPVQKRTWLDSVSDFAKGAWGQVNPKSAAEGISHAFYHPLDTANALGDAQDAVRLRAEAAFKKGDYAQGVLHTLNWILPIIGPENEHASDAIDSGHMAQGLGEAVGNATNLFAPELVKGRIPLPGASKAADLYQSALKPSTTLPASRVASVVKTGLEQGIPVSEAGVEKLGSLIDDLNGKIKATIQADPTRPINPAQAVKDIGQVKARFANQVNPQADLAAIDASKQEFLDQFRSQPGGAVSNMTAEQAQAMKQGTYAQLKGKAYGELKGAQIEAQKALARGLKEELANAFPELSQLNASDSRLLDLQPILEKAVSRIGNHQLMGIGSPLAGVGAKAVSGSSGAGLAAWALKTVLDNPAVKSRIAISLNKAGVNLPTAYARVAGYSNALGQAVSSANTAPPADHTGESASQ